MNKYLLIALALVANAELYAQVTIGSNTSPLPGSLLDLKQFENTAGGITANKGLLLPRVELLDVKELQIAPDTKKQEHIGTIIYAVSNEPEQPEENTDFCSPIPTVESKISGVMVWGGTEWKPLIAKETEAEAPGPSLPSWVHPDVKLTAPDLDGNSYTYRYFGDPAHKQVSLEQFLNAGGVASDYKNFGYWMTENLRSTSYGSNHPGDKLALIPAGGTSRNALVYGYPRERSTVDIRSDVDFKKMPNIGLLYSNGAITHNSTVTPNMQGICPDGWFLPSASDWQNLLDYTGTPEQRAEYAKYPDGEDIFAARTIVTACTFFMDSVHSLGGRGKLAREGAFGLVAVGWADVTSAQVRNNKIFEYPQTPDTGTSASLQYRAGSVALVLNPVYYDFPTHSNPLANQMISVRCRREIDPAP